MIIPSIDLQHGRAVQLKRGSELLLIDEDRCSDAQGCQKPVGDAGHPTRIGRAPVDVLRSQVECQASRSVVSDDGFMDVKCAFRSSRGPTGEVE